MINNMNHKKQSILILFPYPKDVGYAIKSLANAFYSASLQVFINPAMIHFSYSTISENDPQCGEIESENIMQFDFFKADSSEIKQLCDYIKKNNITCLWGLDLPVGHPMYSKICKAGITSIVAYWGAPMSDVFPWWKLALKRIQVILTYPKPDLYIFESNAMARTAVYGRGVSLKQTRIIPLGVDVDTYMPNSSNSARAHVEFNIPQERKIAIFTGHIHKRKGVHIVLKTARYLVEQMGRQDIHFLLLGNKQGEETEFLEIVNNTPTQEFVTFGGYRKDVPRLLSACDFGLILSTGWDSFTQSSLEMAASGLPLVVSNLGGLPETIEQGVTGLMVQPRDEISAGNALIQLLDDDEMSQKMGENARSRIVQAYTVQHQRERLASALSSIL